MLVIMSMCVSVINREFSVSSTIDDVASYVGRGVEESAGEKYEAGEYVLEDLELGSPEKSR